MDSGVGLIIVHPHGKPFTVTPDPASLDGYQASLRWCPHCPNHLPRGTTLKHSDAFQYCPCSTGVKAYSHVAGLLSSVYVYTCGQYTSTCKDEAAATYLSVCVSASLLLTAVSQVSIDIKLIRDKR